jgi:hypothetical protein
LATLALKDRMKFGEKWNLQQNIFSSFFGSLTCLIYLPKEKRLIDINSDKHYFLND